MTPPHDEALRLPRPVVVVLIVFLIVVAAGLVLFVRVSQTLAAVAFTAFVTGSIAWFNTWYTQAAQHEQALKLADKANTQALAMADKANQHALVMATNADRRVIRDAMLKELRSAYEDAIQASAMIHQLALNVRLHHGNGTSDEMDVWINEAIQPILNKLTPVVVTLKLYPDSPREVAKNVEDQFAALQDVLLATKIQAQRQTRETQQIKTDAIHKVVRLASEIEALIVADVSRLTTSI